MSDFMREEKKSESWSFLPGRYFCVSDYHLTVPDGAQVPPMPWSLRSQAGGWSLRFPGFQMDTPLSSIFSHGLFREQPTISSGPGPGGFHSWGLRPPASAVSRKDCGSVSGGKTAAGLPGLSGSFRPGFLQGGCAHGEDEKLVRIAQPALPASRLRGWWAGLMLDAASRVRKR